MRINDLLLTTAAGAAVALAASAFGPTAARSEAGLAQTGLGGEVTGPDGATEGVLVTAKKAGSTMA